MATARATSIPAPVGGLNDRDSIADMPAQYAPILENWWPYPGYLGIRKGSANHVTGFTNAVQTLVEYLPTSGVSKLFAAAGGSIFDVTTAGTVGAAVVTGQTSAQWQDANVTTAGGSFLYLVNGADKPQLFNGTTWTAIDGASSPSITGVTTTSLVHVCVFKSRLYFVVRNSMTVAFLPVGQVGGAAGTLDLSSVFRNGGSIQACYTWTVDAGAGADDHFVVLSTNGEVAVYRGSNPGSGGDFSIIGVFQLGRPLGRRCAAKYGGDLAVNTTEGVFPLGRGLLSASVDRRVALTDKIQNSVSIAANSFSSAFGWQLCLFPEENMMLLNVPATGGAYQFAQNTITGAWTKFTGWNANVLLRASTGLYYADNTKVYKAWVSNVDVSAPIQADCLPAFNYFGNKAFNKYFTMVRPYILTSGNPTASYGLNTNYLAQDPQGTLSFVAPTGMVWGTMTWGTMVWGGGLRSTTGWNTVGAVANSAALRLKVQNNGAEVRFTNVDYVYQPANSVL